MTAPVDETTATEATEAVAVEPTEVVDLTAFEEAVLEVVEDPENVSEEATLAARTAYQALGRNGKTAARKHVETAAVDAVMAGNLPEAQTLHRLKDEILKPIPADTKPRAPRKPKNPTEGVVAGIVAIQLGYALAVQAAMNTENIDANWQEQVSVLATGEAQERAGAYVAWLLAKQEGVEPEVSELEKAAARVALGRAPKGQGRKPKEATVEEVAEVAEAAPVTEQDVVAFQEAVH